MSIHDLHKVNLDTLPTDAAQIRQLVRMLVQQRDLLAQGITEAAVKAGIVEKGAEFGGPMLLMLCEDLADAAVSAASQVQREIPGDPSLPVWSVPVAADARAKLVVQVHAASKDDACTLAKGFAVANPELMQIDDELGIDPDNYFLTDQHLVAQVEQQGAEADQADVQDELATLSETPRG